MIFDRLDEHVEIPYRAQVPRRCPQFVLERANGLALEVRRDDPESGPRTACGDTHVMQGFDVLAFACSVLVRHHALVVEAQDIAAGLGQWLVGPRDGAFLLLAVRPRAPMIELRERPLEL